MAWATKCDRCEKYFDWHEEINAFAFMVYDYGTGKYSVDDTGELDLCPDCIRSLNHWFLNPCIDKEADK